MSQIRVILADDHPLTRQGLKAYLENDPNIALVGEAEDGEAAWKVILDEMPDVALLDIRMPGIDGISLARRIKEEQLPVAPIMLTSYDSQQYVLASLKAGAKGFVLKTADSNSLMAAIQSVATGSLYLDSEVANVMGSTEDVTESLSPREREVLLCAARGLSSKEVAGKLFISERTVQTHLASVYDKLGAHNKTEAMLLALKHGLMTLEELLD